MYRGRNHCTLHTTAAPRLGRGIIGIMGIMDMGPAGAGKERDTGRPVRCKRAAMAEMQVRSTLSLVMYCMVGTDSQCQAFTYLAC